MRNLRTEEERGKVIRELREGQNLSVKELAEALDISEEEYEKIEAGKWRFNGYKMALIAERLQKSTQFFLWREGEEEIQTSK